MIGCWQLGWLNSMLAIEHSPSIPVVSKAPTIILGMDVSHGSPGQSDVSSIAAVNYCSFFQFSCKDFGEKFNSLLNSYCNGFQVVSSRHYPLIQSPKVEMIDSLFKKVSDTEDDGIMRCDVYFDLTCLQTNIQIQQLVLIWIFSFWQRVTFGFLCDHLNGICQYYIGKKGGFKASINLFCDKFQGWCERVAVQSSSQQ